MKHSGSAGALFHELFACGAKKTPISLRAAFSPPEKTSEAQKTLISELKSAGVDTGPAHAAPGTARKPPAAHTHFSNTGLLTCVRGSLPASTAYLLTGSLLQWRTFVQTGKTRFGVSSRAQHRSCRQMPSSSRSCRTLCVWLCGIGVYYGISHIFSFSRCNVPRGSRSDAAGFRPQRAKGRPFAYEPLFSYYTRWIAFFQAVSSKKHKGTDDRISAYQYFVRAYGASLRWQCTK